jgi:glycosyltransferase involved in cell wall biosynthesis
MTRDEGDHSIPVSAVLITLDAERYLDRVLRPLAICSEIVVLDSGSTDGTRDIARRHGVAWHEHPFDGYGPQKRRAVALAKHDWIIAVDADEVLDEAAGTALAGVDWSTADPSLCWSILRRPFIGEREIKHGHWVPDPVVRVFNRQRHDFSDSQLHESVRPTGSVHRLDGSLLHYSYEDLAALFRADYFRLKAESIRQQGRRTGSPELVVRAFSTFIRSYVLRRGFLDGPAGFVVALAGAAHSTVGPAMASTQLSENSSQLDDRAPGP